MRSTTDGGRSLIPRNYVIPVFLALVVAGLAGNLFRYEIFFNIEFVFGSVFAMLALQMLGLGPGVLAGLLISSVTWQLWNHPYAIVLFTCEVLIVGWLNRRRKVTLVLADALYWLGIGIPLTFLFHLGIMHLTVPNVAVTSVKAMLNGIANALVARLIFMAMFSRSRKALFSLREMILNLLALSVLVPSLTILAIESRDDMRDTERRIREDLTQTSKRATRSLIRWLDGHLTLVDLLADLASRGTLPALQRSLDKVRTSDQDFLRLGVLDQTATTVAFSPLLDELGRPSIGRNYADRPFIPLLKETLKPMLSEVVMARFGTPKPMVTLLAPVIADGHYAGYVAGILDFKAIREILVVISGGNGMKFTLLDRNRNVVVTNRAEFTAMDEFRRDGGDMLPLEDGVFEWLPSRRKNVSITDRWRNSFYIKEAGVGSISEWQLVLEQPLAPFQRQLYNRYAALLSWVLVALLAALLFGEIFSRMVVAYLEQLGALSTNLPERLAGGAGLAWVGGSVVEAERLFENFQNMAGALTLKFAEIRAMNAALESKVAERTRSLRESEERYRFFFERNQCVMLVIDPENGGIVDANPAAVEFYGWSREELKAMNLAAINTLSPTEIAAELARAKSQPNYREVFSHRRADGTARRVEVYSGPIQIAGGTLLFSIVHDISESKRAEAALRASEELFSVFIRNSPIYTYIKKVTPTESRVLQASDNFQQMIGISGSAMAGKTMTELFPVEMAVKMTADDWAVVSSGEVLKLDEELNGRSYTTIKFPIVQGDTTLLAGYTIDVTERKRAEARIQRALREKEVMLKEIHHRVKNNMQVIYSLLNLQAQGVADGTVRALFEESRDRVNSMALIHEQLYRSEDLAHIDFKAYLQSLVHGVAGTYKRPEIAVSIDMESLALDVNTGIPCGLIVNELVSNAFKHAFPEGRNGAIRVGMSRNADGGYLLTVADDGVGFPAGADVRTTSSLGLQLVHVLAGQIRGTAELTRAQGTRFVVAFPGPPAAERGRNG